MLGERLVTYLIQPSHFNPDEGSSGLPLSSTAPVIQRLSSDFTPSFPSGHTTSAFCTATSLSLMYPKWYVIVPAYSWATMVGYSRMHLGMHYPLDVLAGAILGTGISLVSFKLQKWIGQK